MNNHENYTYLQPVVHILMQSLSGFIKFHLPAITLPRKSFHFFLYHST